MLLGRVLGFNFGFDLFDGECFCGFFRTQKNPNQTQKQKINPKQTPTADQNPTNKA